MKVCSVIVTYGDRFKLLKQVIEACFIEGVNKIIVIDNDSEEESQKQLKEFAYKNRNRLKVVFMSENTGSAGGYKKGLEEAYNCDDCDYIWLLDDDNKPQEQSLKNLKEFWRNFYDNDTDMVLLSNRPDRTAFKEAVVKQDPNLVLGRRNSFLGLHFFDLFKKLLRVIKRELEIKVYSQNSDIKYGKVVVAPYGGMFFAKLLIDKIGYPRKEFFLYADDHEWSYRVIKNNGNIYVVLDSEVIDIDDNLNGEKSTSIFDAYLNKNNNFKVYYAIRNRVVFEFESVITNNFIYKLNMLLFIFILKLFKRNHNKKRYSIIIMAIKDGLNKNFNRYQDEL